MTKRFWNNFLKKNLEQLKIYRGEKINKFFKNLMEIKGKFRHNFWEIGKRSNFFHPNETLVSYNVLIYSHVIF